MNRQLARSIVWATTLAASLLAQPAFADDYIYKGDCQRAELIRQERTVDKLLPYSRYLGIQRAQFGKDNCGRETMLSVDLTEESRNTSQIVFRFNRSDSWQHRRSGTCTDPQGYVYQVSGKVTVTLQSANNNGVCELYLYSRWQGTDDPNQYMTFSNRLVWLNNFSFAITQTAPSGGIYLTPLAFTGAPAQ